jgi:hypothetical protein
LSVSLSPANPPPRRSPRRFYLHDRAPRRVDSVPALQAERQYRRAVEEFERLRALRPEAASVADPIEPAATPLPTLPGEPSEPEPRTTAPRAKRTPAGIPATDAGRPVTRRSLDAVGRLPRTPASGPA